MKIIKFSTSNVPYPIVGISGNTIIEILSPFIKKKNGETHQRVLLFIWTEDVKWKFWKWNFSF
jgi:hypothetical protein